MVDEMAISIVSAIPEQLGGFIPVIVALTSGIFTFFMPNDAYFYGVLPILSETAAAYGVDKIEIARASIIGQPIHMLESTCSIDSFTCWTRWGITGSSSEIWDEMGCACGRRHDRHGGSHWSHFHLVNRRVSCCIEQALFFRSYCRASSIHLPYTKKCLFLQKIYF